MPKKELTPLEAFYDLIDVYFDNEVVKEKYGITKQTFVEKKKIIETALKRLNYIDKNKIFCISENYLQDIEKIKALEIIKKKPQTLFLVKTCENYDIYFELAQDTALIEDIYSSKEYDLLKEVLL